eukprot:222940-Lingulodinium_polyedra.AAC.1
MSSACAASDMVGGTPKGAPETPTERPNGCPMAVPGQVGAPDREPGALKNRNNLPNRADQTGRGTGAGEGVRLGRGNPQDGLLNR